MKIALRIFRTLFIVSVGIFFITLPFRPPLPVGWTGTVALVVPGFLIIYVEVYLWWRLIRTSPGR